MATPIRLLLEYAGADYKEKLYKCGPPPTFDRSAWLEEKFTLGLDFPNLPYYIEGPVKLTQSAVILRYLGKKHNLTGKTEADQLVAEMLHDQIGDYLKEHYRTCYNPEFNKLREAYEKTLPDKLEVLEKFLGPKKFAVGDYVTYVDFLLFEYLEIVEAFSKGQLANFAKLADYHKRILALEPIHKYWNSDKAIKFPFNGAPAHWGGQYSDILNKSE